MTPGNTINLAKNVFQLHKEGVIASQWMFGVVQTTEDLPIYHEVFDGNQAEAPTLTKVLERFPHIRRLIIVADHRQQRGGFGHIPFEDLLGDRKTLSGLNKTACELALDSIVVTSYKTTDREVVPTRIVATDSRATGLTSSPFVILQRYCFR